jgi:hypothetical protein
VNGNSTTPPKMSMGSSGSVCSSEGQGSSFSESEAQEFNPFALDFDVFRVVETVGKHEALVLVASKIFRMSGLVVDDEEAKLRLSLTRTTLGAEESGIHVVTWCGATTFQRWINAVEAGYLNKPYHNSVHACDVMATANSYLLNSGIAPVPSPAHNSGKIRRRSSRIAFADPEWQLTQFALLIAAATHDVGHLGVMNPFLRQTHHQLAADYPDTLGVLEAFHAATALRLMSPESGNDILQLFSEADARWVRQAVVDLILITDLTKQRAFLESWHARRRVAPTASSSAAACDAPFEVASSPSSRPCVEEHISEGRSEPAAVWDLDLQGPGAGPRAGRLELAKVLIKAADLSNPTKEYGAYLTWTSKILSEFYDQVNMTPLSPINLFRAF